MAARRQDAARVPGYFTTSAQAPQSPKFTSYSSVDKLQREVICCPQRYLNVYGDIRWRCFQLSLSLVTNRHPGASDTTYPDIGE